MPEPRGVLHLRVVLTTREYASLVDFFCRGLGLEPAESWTHDGGHGVLMRIGDGSLEVFDQEYARYVDEIEVGQAMSGQVRLALKVADVDAALRRLAELGARIVHAPVPTPWGDRDARVESPDGLQVTLFESNADPIA